MYNVPKKLRGELASDPLYKLCLRREALHDHECAPDPLTGKLIDWEHAIIHAGKQVQARWAIVPICWWAHRGPGLVKRINVWIALNRATDTEILEISRAFDYFRYRHKLNGDYGAYEEPKPVVANGINYGFVLTESMWPEMMGEYAEPFDRGSYLVGSDSEPESKYVVDFEGDEEDPVICNCDAFIKGGQRPCKHIRTAALARASAAGGYGGQRKAKAGV